MGAVYGSIHDFPTYRLKQGISLKKSLLSASSPTRRRRTSVSRDARSEENERRNEILELQKQADVYMKRVFEEAERHAMLAAIGIWEKRKPEWSFNVAGIVTRILGWFSFGSSNKGQKGGFSGGSHGKDITGGRGRQMGREGTGGVNGYEKKENRLEGCVGGESPGSFKKRRRKMMNLNSNSTYM
jgi:hypothetical protein